MGQLIAIDGEVVTLTDKVARLVEQTRQSTEIQALAARNVQIVSELAQAYRAATGISQWTAGCDGTSRESRPPTPYYHGQQLAGEIYDRPVPEKLEPTTGRVSGDEFAILLDGASDQPAS